VRGLEVDGAKNKQDKLQLWLRSFVAEGFFQNVALNFSGTGHRPLIDKLHAARNFEACKPLAAKVDQLFFRRLLSGL
jgi:hypothetical protein